MTKVAAGIFNFADNLGMASLSQRTQRSKVLYANIANSETPGYRALGYDFEQQLQSIAELNQDLPMQATDGRHFRNSFTQADGQIEPDVYVRPTESVPEDGNTVDVDQEMARLAQNKILYDATVEMIKRKLGILRYAITGGR